jgi:hypothetical protein
MLPMNQGSSSVSNAGCSRSVVDEQGTEIESTPRVSMEFDVVAR